MTIKERIEESNKRMGTFAAADGAFMGAFGGAVAAAFDSSVLDAKTMELIIVAVSVARKCEPCILAHVPNFVKAGGTREELIAGMNAAALICGGPGVAYGSFALEVFDALKAE